MSILESFYLLFKSDTSDAEKGLKKLDGIAENLIDRFKELTIEFLGFSTLIGGIKKSIDYAIDLSQASQSLNINTEELDAWGNAVRKTGGSIEGFESSIKSFSEHLGTTANVAIKLLPQLADSFQKLGRFRAMNYGKMLGLDEATILLLQHGRREVDAYLKRQKDLGLVTKRDSEVFLKFRNDLQDAGHAVRSLFTEIAMMVLPTLDLIINKFTDLAIVIRKHPAFIKGLLIPAIAILIPMIKRLGKAVLGLLGPWGRLGLVIAFIYDDISSFINGGDSLIGRAVHKWPILGKVFDTVAKSAKRLFDLLLKMWKLQNKLTNPFMIFNQINKGRYFDFGKHKDELLNKQLLVNKGQQALDIAMKSNVGILPKSDILNNNLNNKSVVINIGNIDINTAATDAEGISLSLSDTLQSHYRQTIFGISDGLKA